MKLFKNILTGPDDSTYDLVRVLTFVSATVGIGLQVFVVGWRNASFDFTAFGTGTGLLIAAGAGGMWARKDTEKDVNK